MKAIVPMIIGALVGSATVLPIAGADEDDRYSPVHTILRAAREGDAALKSLLATGVNINATDEDDWTPLMQAGQGGHIETVKVLRKAGATGTADAAKLTSDPAMLKVLQAPPAR